MKYKVEDRIFDDIEDVLDYCIESDYHSDDDYFEEWVNERYTAYEVLDQGYSLDNLLDDFCEQQNENDWDDARYELNHADVGDEVECQTPCSAQCVPA